MKSLLLKDDMEKLYNRAMALGLITVLYNLIEGIVSIYFAVSDKTLALLGFGVDSFVEVISGAGILHMIMRIKRNPSASRDTFEKHALYVTGFSFYLLSAGLVAGAAINLYNDTKPDATVMGTVISTISIATMWLLYVYKLKVGKALGSQPIISDAQCTKACLYLSVVLLISSLLYEIFKVGYFDIAGALGISWFSFREGREAIMKGKNSSFQCCSDD